jgi:hypothetical protein
MKPETQYQARLLADLILRDNGDGNAMPRFEQGRGDVRLEVELKGMVAGIRRELLLNNAAVAKMVADQLEETCNSIDIAKVIKAKVDQVVHAELRDLDNEVRRQVQARIAEITRPYIRAKADMIIEEQVRKLFPGWEDRG